jgi:hypothetical protein
VREVAILPRFFITVLWLGLAATASMTPPAAAANAPCTFNEPRPRFPLIPIWSYAGAYQDSSLVKPNRCIGTFHGPLPESVRTEPRTITVRFMRDRRAEARKDFGGYRIYRVLNSPDTTKMELIRRFSRQRNDERTWSFSVVDTSDVSLPFKCNGNVVNDSIVTFIDPDSNGNWVKVCRQRIPPNDPRGVCDPRGPRGDSVLVLLKPPGPHEGFRVWYAVTYEGRNLTADANYADLFVPDTTGIIGPCGDPSNPLTCPNLNNKCYNMTQLDVEPTGGPTANLEHVGVVPNPFRAHEAWDQPGQSELHFINLPARATIKIYTAAGDLVARLEHDDTVHDFERWNLKNQDGRDVASGIYMYRIESHIGSFNFQDRFIVIR